MKGDIVMEASNLCRYYEISRGNFKKPAILKALDGVSFTLEKGRTLAVVGESGCGKSTLARLVTMIEEPTAGELKIQDFDIVAADGSTKRNLNSNIPQK